MYLMFKLVAVVFYVYNVLYIILLSATNNIFNATNNFKEYCKWLILCLLSATKKKASATDFFDIFYKLLIYNKLFAIKMKNLKYKNKSIKVKI